MSIIVKNILLTVIFIAIRIEILEFYGFKNLLVLFGFKGRDSEVIFNLMASIMKSKKVKRSMFYR